MTLPREGQAIVARALSAYLRATPARELPGDLRKWRSWRPQTIASRSPEIVARLDDDGFRAKVLEWLDDKPSLPKKDARALRLAAERSPGWEDEVLALVAPPREKQTSDTEQLRERLAKELQKEKEKTAAAKDEARKAKENARHAVQAEKKRAADSVEELSAVRSDLRLALARIKDLETEVAKARQLIEGRDRREKRAVERADSEKARLQERARVARKEAAELRQGLRALEKQLEAVRRSARTRSSTAKARPAPRRVLQAPPGLLEDSPDTLIAWLKDTRPHLLVDGYNVSQLGFPDLSLSDQRDRLLQEVARVARKHKVSATIVFDGSEVAPGTRRKPRGPVELEYSKPDETADDHLVARLESLPPDPVVVVTNDRELQERARAARATVATSDQLLALLR